MTRSGSELCHAVVVINPDAVGRRLAGISAITLAGVLVVTNAVDFLITEPVIAVVGVGGIFATFRALTVLRIVASVLLVTGIALVRRASPRLPRGSVPCIPALALIWVWKAVDRLPGMLGFGTAWSDGDGSFGWRSANVLQDMLGNAYSFVAEGVELVAAVLLVVGAVRLLRSR